MLAFLSRFFGIPDRLIRLGRGTNRRRFASAFAKSQLTFLSVPDGMEAGLDPNTMTKEQFLEQTELAAKYLSENEVHMPFHFKASGKWTLPLFSQKRFAEHFVCEYVKSIDRVVPFFLLTNTGRSIVASVGEGVTIVLNPGTQHEYSVSEQDIAAVLDLSA